MDLQVQKRETFGRGVRATRKSGLIPAELYGHGIENIHLNVPEKEFIKIFNEAGEHTVVNVKIDKDTRPVLIHDTDEEPLTGRIRHIDFYQVRMDEKIKAMIPIIFTGESPVVKDKSGVLIKALHEIEVEALPNELPHEIEVSIEGLDAVGKSVYVKDVKVEKGVKIIVDPETVIASITELAAEEVVVVVPPSVEDVKVEGEEEVEERRKEKEGKVEKEASPEAKK